MNINEITGAIIGGAIEMHKYLGPGLLESAYEECMAYELTNQGLHIEHQKPVPVVYKDVRLNYGYRMDLLVEGTIIVELKTVEFTTPVHEAQILTYLKCAKKPYGLLINFHFKRLTDGLKRYWL
jgi:GxxExxY protein